jgi:hypothetical protein
VKHDKLLERYFDLLACVEREITLGVQAERSTVQQILRSYALSTKVVDNERAAV